MARFHKLLRINLKSRTAVSENIPEEMERLFLGGKTLATAYLCRELKAGIDPLGAENKFIIAAGPLTGTIAPASARFEIVTKSPLTGIYLDCNSGGHFGSELKAAGFDLVIIEEISAKPVILFIEDDEVRFIDAAQLWGQTTYETELGVRKLLQKPEARVLSIGPAGENLVKFACLSNDFSRNAARGGSGAVLGSKRLKAIAVKGSRDIPVDNLQELRKAADKAKTVIFNNPWVEGQRRYGTVRSVGIVNTNGFLPTENFTKGCLDDVEGINEIAFEKRIGKILSCGECPVACSKGYSRKNVQMEGPEYETVGLFGPNLGISDPDLIAGFNFQCNQYGLDTITAGALIGSLLLTDIFEGKTESRAEIITDLLEKIAYRRGIGDLLAEGPAVTAKEMGLEYQMPHIKGLSFPAYDPRVSPGTALAYMTADRGACHLRAWPVGRELGGMWAEDDVDSRVDFVKNQQEEKAAEESLTVCQFVYGIGLLDDVLGEMLTASTGEKWDLERMKLAGERCWTLSRLFNCREGISRKDDYLPEKFTREGIKNGPLEGKLISLETQDYMLDRYYHLRGWDEDGIPGKELIERLELGGWTDG
ncbi:MAG: aldehyde ferredoxin oxidoreductase family protein [Spirochaetales bacterium]|nr:aldehyde ferredoxin oxidoreductase family protein [Spirochaetales bacterium]